MIEYKTIKEKQAEATQKFDEIQKKINKNNNAVAQLQNQTNEFNMELLRLAGEFRALEDLLPEDQREGKEPVEEKKVEDKKVEQVADNKK